MTYKTGISKTKKDKDGNPKSWAGWFCDDRNCSQDPVWGSRDQVSSPKKVTVNQALANTLVTIKDNQERIMRGLTKIIEMLASGEVPLSERKFDKEAPMPEEDDIPVIEDSPDDLPF